MCKCSTPDSQMTYDITRSTIARSYPSKWKWLINQYRNIFKSIGEWSASSPLLFPFPYLTTTSNRLSHRTKLGDLDLARIRNKERRQQHTTLVVSWATRLVCTLPHHNGNPPMPKKGYKKFISFSTKGLIIFIWGFEDVPEFVGCILWYKCFGSKYILHLERYHNFKCITHLFI